MYFLQSIPTSLEIATLVSAILVFIAAIANILVTIWSAKKKSFMEAVTKLRIGYIKELRKITADFCYFATAQPAQSNQPSQRDLGKAGYKLKLMMNPAGYTDKWDGEAVALIKKIEKNMSQTDVDEFVALMQSWFALEWSGIMEEAKKGVLSGKEKDKLRNKFYTQYRKYK
jgi:hypothetical protein